MNTGAPGSRRLPYPTWWPVLAGAIVGVIVRLTFAGEPDGVFAVMSHAFIYFSPMLVAAVTVYLAERRARRTWTFYFWAPVAANALYVLGTLAILIEGMICAIVILPLFALIGGVSGLLMGAVCRLTRWPKQTLSCLAVLPFIVAGLERPALMTTRIEEVRHTVWVDAAPARIWQQILDAPQIVDREIDLAWLHRIGVPLPREGRTTSMAAGSVRKVRLDDGIHFDEIIQEAIEPRFLRWTYSFHEDSFPPGTLDEHVVIGGAYFDLLDTAYRLEPRGEGTWLSVHFHYRITTPFDWYARPVARLLLGNLAESNLRFYKRRSERLADRDEAPTGGALPNSQPRNATSMNSQ